MTTHSGGNVTGAGKTMLIEALHSDCKAQLQRMHFAWTHTFLYLLSVSSRIPYLQTKWKIIMRKKKI
jgi:hypothetical protein